MKPATAQCAHAYVNSDARCLHCDADLSKEMAAAVDRLNEFIQQTLSSWSLDPVMLQQTSAQAVRS